MQKQQLIDNAIAKGYQVEFSEDLLGLELIGINKGKWNYHWFRVYSDGSAFFDHTYSQITGKTKKGWRHTIKVNDSLGFYNDLN